MQPYDILIVLAKSLFQFMRPQWAQLQDLDTILLYVLYLVFAHHYFMQSYLIVTSAFFI